MIDGGQGNDTVNAGDGDGDGDDYIYVGQGNDVVDGGAGLDWILSGVNFNLGSQSLRFENLVLLDVASATAANGSSGDNWIIGNQFANSLNGGAGNDILDGLFYTTINSIVNLIVNNPQKVTGDDTLTGGTGNDTYRIDSGNDITKEIAGTRGGNDTVEFNGTVATDSYTLLDGVDNLKIVRNLKEGVGNNLSNRIFGDILDVVTDAENERGIMPQFT